MTVEKDVLVKIVESCLSIDQSSAEVYGALQESFADHPLRSFWQNMKEEEETHVAFWSELLELVKEGHIPQFFDRPHVFAEELEELAQKATGQVAQAALANSVDAAFLIAYKMEFYMLHPAFEALFHYASGLPLTSALQNPDNDYEQHLGHFIAAFSKYGGESAEMVVLGSVLNSLWLRNRELAIQAHRDPLTGLLNRRGFMMTVRPIGFVARRRGEDVGTIILDVDLFKQLNDQFGHQVGDKVLQGLSKRLTEALRGSDVLGRHGGEEFVAFCYPVDPASFHALCEKVREAISATPIAGQEVKVSIGGATGTIGDDVEGCLEALLKEADECLYEAKAAGRNRSIVRLLN